MSAPGFKPSPNGTAVSVANHNTGLLELPDRKARCHQIRVHDLVKSGMSLVGLPRREYFPPLQFTCRNCGGGEEVESPSTTTELKSQPVWCWPMPR
ncbi:hypothetical protein TNCV_3195791 [Trichonephila clavipes]|nr:hypothetical protein TNCV_3195791 [Trichonephila clavipes]